MFILFDLFGERTLAGQHIKNPEAMRRAMERRAKARGTRIKKYGKGKNNGKEVGQRNVVHCSATIKATYDEEMKLFKAIVRHITRHELDEQQKKWFQMETRAKLRRLAMLGIAGNQPAIAGYCRIQAREQQQIVQAIVQQKIGANPKAIKAHKEFQERMQAATEQEKNQSKMPFKLARVATGAAVRWKKGLKGQSVGRCHRKRCARTRKSRRLSRSTVHLTATCMHEVWPNARDNLDATSNKRWL